MSDASIPEDVANTGSKGPGVIKVLVVEDSPVAREFLVETLNADPEMSVIGTASNGTDALRVLASKKPDIVVMDLHMPHMNGVEATRRIMASAALPIIIVSAIWNPAEVEATFHALEAGAVAVLEKPAGMGHPDHEASTRELLQTVRLMSEAKVVGRRIRPPRARVLSRTRVEPRLAQIRLVAMGTSTGGPPVLQTILSELTGDFPVPVLIVQHIAAGFLEGMIRWLNESSNLPIHVATAGEIPLPGHVYFAPDGVHTGIGRGGQLVFNQGESENGLRPSISYLFRTVADVLGEHAAGVLLTGMGKDGAAELKLMRTRGAVTIAQDRASSVVHGLAGEAIRLDAADYVLSPEEIATTLQLLVGKER